MDPGPTISRSYTRHKWVGRMICSQANVSAHAQDLLRLPESMTIIKNRTDNLRFSFPLHYTYITETSERACEIRFAISMAFFEIRDLFSESFKIDSIKETVYQGTLDPFRKALLLLL